MSCALTGFGGGHCKSQEFNLTSLLFLSVYRHHKKAVRGVAFHRTYPLLASASDDGSVIVCHGTVYK